MPRPANDGKAVSEAGAPFDDPKADIIIRSGDDVDFKMHKIILSLVSPVWEIMLTLPQDVKGVQADSDEWKDGLPVVRLTEYSDTLRLLLSLCHPRMASAMAPTDIRKCNSLLAAARKYEVKVVAQHVSQIMMSEAVLKSDPLLVWSVATRFNMDKQMKIAVRALLQIPVQRLLSESRDWPDLVHVSGLQFCRLLDYHTRCSDAAASTTLLRTVIEKYKSMAPLIEDWKCTPKTGCSRAFSITIREWMAHHSISGPQWLINYQEKALVRVRETPIGARVMDEDLVNRMILTAATCYICGSKGVTVIQALARLWASAIDETVAKVPFNPNQPSEG